ncbi:MAG: MAPEG family protein [Burkholderiales bacterium]
MPLALPALLTLLAVLWFVIVGFYVGRARTKYKVPAPATTGNPDFERAFRVQMNELEQLVAFLPPMWIFAWLGNPRWAAIACAVWLVGRVLYAFGYWSAAEKRHWGFLIASMTLVVTWIAALLAVLRALSIP